MEQVIVTSFFGKLPEKEEYEVAKDLVENIEEAWGRMFIPLFIWNKEDAVTYLKKAKEDLDRLV